MYLLALKVSRGTIFHIRKYGTSRYLLKDSKVTLICLPGLPQFLFILFGPLKIISLIFFRVYCLIGFCFYWSPIKRHHFTPLQLTCCTPFIIVGILKTEHDYCCVSFLLSRSLINCQGPSSSRPADAPSSLLSLGF